MNLKSKIKNDLWYVNYIVPFVKKELAHGDKLNTVKKLYNAYSSIHPVRGSFLKRSVGRDTAALLNSIKITINTDSHFIYFIDPSKTLAAPGNIISNFTLDYSKIINGTFDELSTKAVDVDEYGQEARLVVDGIKALRDRIVDAIDLSELSDKTKNKQIQYFINMFNTPARHFDEALQRILFFNQILWQTRHRLNGLGRLDKILERVYKQDIENNYCTKKEIKDLIDDFLNQLSRYFNFKSDALEGDIGQIIILGGLETDNTYFCNDLTYMFLEAQAKSKKPDPKTLLRVSKNMPDTLLNTAVICLDSRTGSPLFSNDDIVIKNLKDFGIDDNDAYNYCTSACWEPFVVGKSFDQNNMAVFNFDDSFDKFMDLAKTYKYSEFIEFLNDFIDVNNKCFSDFLHDTNEMKWAKDPFVSLFTDKCSETRNDVSQGGAEYSNYGITTVGLANVVDSLFFIKKYVFEDKKYNIESLNKARLNDFKDFDDIYDDIINEKHFYGHDDKETVFVVNMITDGMSFLAKSFKNKLGGTVKFGLSSPAYIMSSKNKPADFSGRKKGMAYNTHISCRDAAYTEIVNFASQLHYDKHRFNGNVIDFFISPDFLKNNSDKFVLFLKKAIVKGFFQMQMNVMDSKTLIDAKKYPEKYKSLIVRVWGFSAYFNDLPSDYKDLLIERAKMSESII